MHQHKLKKPCGECPFSKKCAPGSLGGSHPHVYVGQIHGPFWLPCHSDTDYSDPNWKSDLSKLQCAGAAIFRANLGLSEKMPTFIHKLPSDTTTCFSSIKEFCEFHEADPNVSSQELLKKEISRLNRG